MLRFCLHGFSNPLILRESSHSIFTVKLHYMIVLNNPFDFFSSENRLLFRQKDSLNSVYQNKGTYKDAVRFLQADPEQEKPQKPIGNRNTFLHRVKNFTLKLVYRTYLLLWFSVYFCVSVVFKWIK